MRLTLLIAAAAALFTVAGAEKNTDVLLESARRGDAASQLRLADEFMFGKNGRTVSPPLAVYWFRQAALQDSPAGQYNLALCYINGWGGNKRVAAGSRYLFKALQGGVVKAAALYASLLYNGVPAAEDPEGNFPEIKAEPEEALKLLRQYAAVDAAAEKLLAQYLFKQVEQYGSELCALLAKHSRQQTPDPEMLVLYAACLRSGVGTDADPAAAAALLERAAEMDSPEAMAQLAEMLYLGFGIKADPERAGKLSDAALALGSPRAMVDRGMAHLNGVRFPHDPHRAYELFNMAAAKKYPPAWRQLGFCFSAGVGTAKDETQAFKYYLLAAENGDVPAMFYLAECFRCGKGSAVDLRAAYNWYLRGAKSGEVNAMRETGMALLQGCGVPRDAAAAEKWLKRAAAAGDSTAAEVLGISGSTPF